MACPVLQAGTAKAGITHSHAKQLIEMKFAGNDVRRAPSV
jgi:hypothetical protein